MTQPEALRLANSLAAHSLSRHGQTQAAAELRRLHIENEALGLHLSEWMNDLFRVEAQRDAIQQVVDEQAEDEGLWFRAETAAEAYLQQELRRLHAAVEGAARAAIKKAEEA